MARAQLGQDRPRAALQAARAAASLACDQEWPRRLESMALVHLGRDEEAADAAQDAVRLAPNRWYGHAQLARRAEPSHAALGRCPRGCRSWPGAGPGRSRRPTSPQARWLPRMGVARTPSRRSPPPWTSILRTASLTPNSPCCARPDGGGADPRGECAISVGGCDGPSPEPPVVSAHDAGRGSARLADGDHAAAVRGRVPAPRSRGPARPRRRDRAAAAARRGSRPTCSRPRACRNRPARARFAAARRRVSELDHRVAAVPGIVEEQRAVVADDLQFVARGEREARVELGEHVAREAQRRRRTRRRRRRRPAPARRSRARARRRSAARRSRNSSRRPSARRRRAQRTGERPRDRSRRS